MKKADSEIADRYNRIRFGCGFLRWKPVDARTMKAWCAESDKKCSCRNCNKVTETKNEGTL